MTDVRPNPGSFRDPSGRIYHRGDKVYRTVTDHGAANFEFVRESGLIDRLVADGSLLPGEVVAPDVLGEHGRDSRYVIEHPRLPFISYPYEWPFPALKAAALLHIDVHLAALDHGVTLSDASAYNVQFRGTQPVFIDLLSLRRYRDGEFWAGHRQFCEQFLNPLLLRSKLGIPHNGWYRGTLEGIGVAEINRLLPWHKKLSFNVLTHIVLHDAFQRKAQASGPGLAKTAVGKAVLPCASFKHMLIKLGRWIESFEPADTGKTVWQDYARSHSYTDDEARAKREFVAEFASAVKPAMLWDMGCNTGDYSQVALENGAGYAVGFDFDQGVLELAFDRARGDGMMLQPVFLDGANPAPNQGWNESERLGLAARANADAVIALAFVHHMIIARNIPMADMVEWLVGIAPQGIIEFVPKQDPMVQELLALREDIFPDYAEEAFLQHLKRFARIVKTETVTASGRKLIWFAR